MNDHAPHVSDLRWDRLLADELPGAERDAALAHAASCASCAARHRELISGRDAFAERPIDLAISRAQRAKRSRVVWLAPLGAVAAAAVILLVVGRRGDRPTGELTKGAGPSLVLAAGTPEQLVPLRAGDVVHPGDRVQAAYSAKVDGYGAVLARDGAGNASAYVPSTGDAMVRLPAGTDTSFPQSTILDDVIGTERIAIVWCGEAHPLAPMIAALRAGAPLVLPPGCHSRELELAKQAGP